MTTSSPDDDPNIWDEYLGDLRRADLDNPSDVDYDSLDLHSWPVPGLTFVRIDSVQAACGTSKNQHEEHPGIARLNRTESALSELNGDRANIAFLITGNNQRVHYYMGLSVPSDAAHYCVDEPNMVSYQKLRAMLRKIEIGVEMHGEPLIDEQLRQLIEPLTVHCGIVTGIPASTDDRPSPIERLTTALKGDDFGLLVLAIPIPRIKLSKEEHGLLNEIERYQQGDPPTDKILNCEKLQKAHLKNIQDGIEVGHWLTAVYFFAPDKAVYDRLNSEITAIYFSETSLPNPIRTHTLDSLREHVNSFGLLRNKRGGMIFHELMEYKFLSPLNSKFLSAFIDLPRGQPLSISK